MSDFSEWRTSTAYYYYYYTDWITFLKDVE